MHGTDAGPAALAGGAAEQLGGLVALGVGNVRRDTPEQATQGKPQPGMVPAEVNRQGMEVQRRREPCLVAAVGENMHLVATVCQMPGQIQGVLLHAAPGGPWRRQQQRNPQRAIHRVPLALSASARW